MENVAKWDVNRCDQQLINELIRCGINVIQAPIPHPHPEVHTHITGRLGDIIFRRAWSYWIVDCWVPFSIAKEIYDTLVGKQDIRVGGHCGRMHPRDYGTTWINQTTGKRITSMREKAQCEKLANEAEDTELKKIGKDILAKFEFAEDIPKAANEYGFVDTYHIDTELGLYIFVRIVHKHNCTQEKPTIYD